MLIGRGRDARVRVGRDGGADHRCIAVVAVVIVVAIAIIAVVMAVVVAVVVQWS